MKRIAPVVVILGLAALAAWWLLVRKSPSATTTAPTAEGSASTSSTAHAKKADPRTLPKGSIAGTVKDDKGALLADATVCFDRSSDELPGGLDDNDGCVQTDASGAYVIPNLLAADYSIVAGKPHYVSATYRPKADENRATFPLAAGEVRTGIDLVLGSGAVELLGTVSDINGGPIAHAKVRSRVGRWGSGDATPYTESDEKGAFSLWVQPGAHQLTARADGYAESSAIGRAPGRVDLQLTPESSLAGTVVDARTNQPLADVDITVMLDAAENNNFATNRYYRARSSDRGAFKVTGLTPGRYIGRTRSDKGFGRSEGSLLVGLGQTVEGMVIRVVPAATVRGKVVMSGKSACHSGIVGLAMGPGNEINGGVEDDGTFAIEGVLAGSYTITAWCDDGVPREKYPEVVVADKDVEGLVVEIDPGAIMTGTVTTAAGAPVADGSLNASLVNLADRARQRYGNAQTHADGTYKMTGLAPGKYSVDIQSGAGRSPADGFPVDVAGQTTKNFVLEDAATVTGIVVDATGAPVPNASVRAALTVSTMRWQGENQDTTDATGAFAITTLRSAEYQLTAWSEFGGILKAPGSKDNASATITAVSGKTVTAKLVVESSNGFIKGTVVDADGKPVSDAYVASAREETSDNGVTLSAVDQTRGTFWNPEDKLALTAVDGTFTIGHLPQGSFSLRAFRRGGGEAVLEGVKTGTTSAKLQIATPSSIAGIAKTASGPLPDLLTVNVKNLDNGFVREETFFRTNGAFTMRDLPPGKFRLVASGPSGSGETTVELAAGENKTGVEVTMDALLTLTGRVTDAETKKPVPGMQLAFALAAGTSTFSFEEGDPDSITDDAGAFTLRKVPKNKVSIHGIPRDFGKSEYGFFQIVRDYTKATQTTIPVGDIHLVKKKLHEGEKEGWLGIDWEPFSSDASEGARVLKVKSLEPGSPAAKSELEPGDVITAINDLPTNDDTLNVWGLLQAPPGATVSFTTARGPTVTLTFAPPK